VCEACGEKIDLDGEYWMTQMGPFHHDCFGG
jgi:hypothetical protein